MGLKYYSKDLNHRSLSSNIDLSLYENTAFSYYQNASRTSPSTLKTNIDNHIYASIRNYSEIDCSRKSTDYYHNNNIYANISKSVTKSIPLLDETFYTTLDNTNSTNVDNNRTYQNVKSKNTNKSGEPLHIYANLQENYQKRSSVKNEPSKEIQSTSICSKERKQVDIETRTNTNTIQMVKKLEVNLAPSCRDKSLLYRTKIPAVIASFRQRQTMQRTKRHNRRRATPCSLLNSVETTQKNSNSATAIDKSQRDDTFYENQQSKSVSNQLYNEIQPPKLSDSQSFESICYGEGEEEEEGEEELSELRSNFHKILQQQVFAWYPTETLNEEELKSHSCSASVFEESIQQDELTNIDEEGLCPHDTFEDFLLRRRPKSSCSTLINATQMAIARTLSQDLPNEPLSMTSRKRGVTLGLDRKDVDFIHEIIERSQGDHPLSNRITALREAYIRAENKRKTLIRKKAVSQADVNKKVKIPPLKPSLTASKVREELKKYDLLPITQTPVLDGDEYDDDEDDDDDDDDTYYTYYRHRTSCTIPAVLSTAHRILNFVSSVKRQIQKNFHDIRTRILIEAMPVPQQHRSRHRYATSGPSHRYTYRSKPVDFDVQRTNSHHSMPYPNPNPNPILRRQIQRTRSSTSQIASTHRHSYPYSSTEHILSDRKRTFRITPCKRRL